MKGELRVSVFGLSILNVCVHPQGILEASIKITNEPPTGMQANLHKSLDNFNQVGHTHTHSHLHLHTHRYTIHTYTHTHMHTANAGFHAHKHTHGMQANLHKSLDNLNR